MAWIIEIKADTVDAAMLEVLRVKHEIADKQHFLPDLEHAESWAKRAANDSFENFLRQLPKNSAESIVMTASGGLRLATMSIEVK